MIKQTVSIHTEYIKLDQLLKFVGVADTGGMAKEIIMGGAVSVNKYVCRMRGKKVYPGDQVTIDEYCFEVEKNEN